MECGFSSLLPFESTLSNPSKSYVTLCVYFFSLYPIQNEKLVVITNLTKKRGSSSSIYRILEEEKRRLLTL